MKTKTIFIMLAIIAALCGIGFLVYKKRKAITDAAAALAGGDDDKPPVWDNSTANQRYSKFYDDKVLFPGIAGAEVEVTMLQKLMNSYAGRQVVNVNGVYDEQMALVLKGMTSTENTMIDLFLRDFYLPKKGAAAARKILKDSLNNKPEQSVVDQMLAIIQNAR